MRAIAIVVLLLFVVTVVVGCGPMSAGCNPDKCTCSRDKKVKRWGEERVREAEAKQAAEKAIEKGLTPEKP